MSTVKAWLWVSNRNGVPSSLSRDEPGYDPVPNVEVRVDVSAALMARYEAAEAEWDAVQAEVAARERVYFTAGQNRGVRGVS